MPCSIEDIAPLRDMFSMGVSNLIKCSEHEGSYGRLLYKWLNTKDDHGHGCVCWTGERYDSVDRYFEEGTKSLRLKAAFIKFGDHSFGENGSSGYKTVCYQVNDKPDHEDISLSMGILFIAANEAAQITKFSYIVGIPDPVALMEAP